MNEYIGSLKDTQAHINIFAALNEDLKSVESIKTFNTYVQTTQVILSDDSKVTFKVRQWDAVYKLFAHHRRNWKFGGIVIDNINSLNEYINYLNSNVQIPDLELMSDDDLELMMIDAELSRLDTYNDRRVWLENYHRLENIRKKEEDKLRKIKSMDPKANKYAINLLFSEAYCYEILSSTDSGKTATIRKMEATKSPKFKPEFVPGGFSGVCINQENQEWVFKSKPDSYPTEKIRLTKRGWHGRMGKFVLSNMPYQKYDYNF